MRAAGLPRRETDPEQCARPCYTEPDKHGLPLRARILFRRRRDARRVSETPRFHDVQGYRVGACLRELGYRLAAPILPN